MKKYKNLFIILGVIGFFVILSASGRFFNKQSSAKMIFFYGNTCPHCKDVDRYIAANKVKDKISFQELEVYNNKTNAALLAAKAKICQFDTTRGVPVPFFFDGEECYLGSDQIIDFFEDEINLVAEKNAN